MRYEYRDLHRAVSGVFLAHGYDLASAAVIADAVLFSEFRGVRTHGVCRIPFYLQKLAEGSVSASNYPLIDETGGSILRVAGNRSLGIITAYATTERLIEVAMECDVAIGLVRDSSNFGAAGFYADLAARQGMVCLVLSNSTPYVAPLGVPHRTFGTNPISLGLPRPGKIPLVIDLSLASVTKGQVDLRASQRRPFTSPILQDKYGRSSKSVSAFQDMGTILPLGSGDGNERKGLALLAIVDLLAGVLTGASFGPLVNSGSIETVGHFILCFRADLGSRLEDWLNLLTSHLGDEDLIPGKVEANLFQRNLKSGVELDASALAILGQCV